MKRDKSLSTIALTILPLTPARKILRYVLKTRKTVNKPKSKTSTQFQSGMTIFNKYLIRVRKMESTLPLPPLFNENSTFSLIFLTLRCYVLLFLFLIWIRNPMIIITEAVTIFFLLDPNNTLCKIVFM